MPIKTIFGPWVFDPKKLTLNFTPARYQIDLETIDSSAEMLDWIFQLAGKETMVSPSALGHLVGAFDEIFHPQANLCSGGASKKINAKKFLREKYS